MLPGSVEITDRLAQIAPEYVEAYRAALSFHFALWKWQRISDQPSLSFLRRLLVRHGLIEPNPEPGWIVNRGASAYVEALGQEYADSWDALPRERLTGHVPSNTPLLTFDAGSGNNTANYERSTPGVIEAGSGLSLVFAVDETLRNWLHEPFGSDRIAAYRSDLAASVFKGVDIWSVNRFLVPDSKSPDFDPIQLLEKSQHDGTISAQVLLSVLDGTKETLGKNRLGQTESNMLITAVALGYLIDAIASRVRCPNGMLFSYPDAAVWAEAIGAVLSYVESNSKITPSGERLLSHTTELDDIRGRIFRHLEDTSLKPDADIDLAKSLPQLADLFKATGFELRARKGDVALIEVLHTIGNELWRWYFFIKDFNTWNETAHGSRLAFPNARVVRAWLERPWGVLRREDMRLALAEGFDSGEEVPQLLPPLMPLLRSSVDDLLKESFSSVKNIAQRLDVFIEQRCRLRDLRELIHSVNYETETSEANEGRELAGLLVELLTLWFYRQSEQDRRKMVSEELLPLVQALHDASWLKDPGSTPEIPLSRRQLRLFEEYQSDPRAVIDRLFSFEPGICLLDRLDVFPIEQFWILPAEKSPGETFVT